MSAKFYFLTGGSPGWTKLSPFGFDLTGVNRLPFVCASKKHNSIVSSKFASEAVVRGLSHPGQPVAGIHDPHSLESADG